MRVTEPSRSGPPLPLLALALAAFAIGTTEFVIMGLPPAIAADLAIGLPDAGLLVTGYAAAAWLGGRALAMGLPLVQLPLLAAALAAAGVLASTTFNPRFTHTWRTP